ncbi:GDSL esterase/lipase [Glycine soja]|nr:GDSL esterase/lipase [Glycine soja]
MAGSSVFTSCIFLSLVIALAISGFNFKGSEAARAFFVFGDSLVDNGNNNYLATTARADAPPYGIDYPTRRPTGRFSNGLNIPDFISQELGSESTLPYLSPELNGERLFVGANFASAGIGVLNDTGVQFVCKHHQNLKTTRILPRIPTKGEFPHRR